MMIFPEIQGLLSPQHKHTSFLRTTSPTRTTRSSLHKMVMSPQPRHTDAPKAFILQFFLRLEGVWRDGLILCVYFCWAIEGTCRMGKMIPPPCLKTEIAWKILEDNPWSQGSQIWVLAKRVLNLPLCLCLMSKLYKEKSALLTRTTSNLSWNNKGCNCDKKE